MIGPGGLVEKVSYRGSQFREELSSDMYEFIKSRCSCNSDDEFSNHEFQVELCSGDATILSDNFLGSNISFNWEENCK